MSLQTDKLYDVEELRDWRRKFGFEAIIRDLTAKITGANLKDVQLLSPEAEEHLRKLAESKIADLNFNKYTELFERQITDIDLAAFIRQLEGVKGQLAGSKQVQNRLQIEVLFLKGMLTVIDDMKEAMLQLKSSVEALESEVRSGDTFIQAFFLSGVF